MKTAADRKAPGTVAGTTLDGDRVSLADYRGKVVVVNVWGSWCGPCRAEATMLADASRELGGEGVAFLGINSRDPSAGNAQAFVRRFEIPTPALRPAGRTLLAFHGTLPATTMPEHRGHRRAGPGGRQRHRRRSPAPTLVDLVEDAS